MTISQTPLDRARKKRQSQDAELSDRSPSDVDFTISFQLEYQRVTEDWSSLPPWCHDPLSWLDPLYQKKPKPSEVENSRGWFDPLRKKYCRYQIHSRVLSLRCILEQKAFIKQRVLHSRLIWDEGILQEALERFPSLKFETEIIVYEELCRKALLVAHSALNSRHLPLWHHVAAVMGFSIFHDRYIRVSLDSLELSGRAQEETKLEVVMRKAEGERVELFSDPRPREKATREFLREILNVFSSVADRRPRILKEKREAIIADAAHWLPICQPLKKELKKLSDTSGWNKGSREERETLRENLAKKLSISVEEVKEGGRYLKTASDSNTATPWDATMTLVGRKHGVEPSTVEAFYRARDKSKWPTTPTAF